MQPLESVKFRVAKVAVDMNASGVVAGDSRDRGTVEVEGAQRLPDVVDEVTRRVALSRATIVRILETTDNFDQVKVNPAVFVDRVSDAINQALYDQAAEGIVYSPSSDDRWTAEFSRARTRPRWSQSGVCDLGPEEHRGQDRLRLRYRSELG